MREERSEIRSEKKKVYICMPLQGRTPEDIRCSYIRVLQLAENFITRDFEWLESQEGEYMEDPRDCMIQAGKEFELIAKADIVIAPNTYSEYEESRIEILAAGFMGKNVVPLSQEVTKLAMPDLDWPEE